MSRNFMPCCTRSITSPLPSGSRPPNGHHIFSLQYYPSNVQRYCISINPHL